MRRRNFLGMAAAGAAAGTLLPAGGADAGPETYPPAPVRTGGEPWVEIRREHLVWNLRQIEARVEGKPVMAVVKANGYGHGIVEAARVLAGAGVAHFLVARLEEARALRRAGIRGMILNFGPADETEAEEIVRLGVSQSVFAEPLEPLAAAGRRLGRPAHVHVKVDTGLGRLGVHHERAFAFLERVAATPGLALDGVYTTFTEDPAFDPVQLERFLELAGRAARAGFALGLRHAASSAAILDLPAAVRELDLVRPGILLYGLYPSERAEQERKIELRPALALKARIAQVKTLAAGESVSYHRIFTAAQPEPVATIPAGYADGYPRAAAGKADVLIGGRRCAVLAVAANTTIVRLGAARAAPGDEAVLIGRQGNAEISAAELARLTGHSVYSLVIGLSALVPRVVI